MMNCPTCQTPNDPDARFCKTCGAALGSESAVPPAQRPRRRLLLVAILGGGLLVMLVAALAVFWLVGRPGLGVPGAVAIGPEGGTLSLADGAQLTLPPEGMGGRLQLWANAIPATQFVAVSPQEEPELATAAAQLPPHLRLAGPLYRFKVEGPPPKAALLGIPVPAGMAAPHSLDLYAWDGDAWHWVPTRAETGAAMMTADLEGLPAAVALMQTEPGLSTLTADLPAGQAVPAEGQGVLAELLIAGFSLKVDGSIETNPQAAIQSEPGAKVQLIPSLRDWRDDGTLTASAAQVLADPSLRRRHVDAVVGLVLAGGYPGIQIDYQGLDSTHRQVVSTFIQELATALHSQGRSLLVRVAAPAQVSASRWESGAYDWPLISRAADRLQVPLPADPAAQGQVEALLSWAVGQADRTKLQPVLSARAVEVSGGSASNLSSTQALAQLGPLHSTGEGDSVEPGAQVTLSLVGLSSGSPGVDKATGMLHFEVSDEAGEAHQFYLPTDVSLSRQLGQIAEYHLAGLVLEGLLEEAPDPQVWEMLQAYQASTLAPVESSSAWVWTVVQQDVPGETLSLETHPLSEASYEWTAPGMAGVYQVGVALSANGDISSTIPVGSLGVRVALVPTPTPTPVPTRQAVDTLPTPTPKPTRVVPKATPAPAAHCPDSRATITSPANGATIRGVVPFMGTAYLDNLRYYKFEYRPLGAPNWQFLVKFDYKWVKDGELMKWYTSTVAAGVYDIRLIVVDMSGNYPTPCEIRVAVRR